MPAATHKSLAAALAAFQGAAPTLRKDAENPHFRSRFTPLDTIVETIRPLLSQHGLAWTALPGYDENTGHPVLEYRLIHADSGEEILGRMPLLLTKNDPQGMGSALTYARRYALSAVLNLVSDEDDDGHQASQPGQPHQEHKASEKQRNLIFVKARERNLTPSALANLTRLAAGADVKFFNDEDEAEKYLKETLMPNLPARLVNPVLEKIAEAKA
jgi:hypothetical protein